MKKLLALLLLPILLLAGCAAQGESGLTLDPAAVAAEITDARGGGQLQPVTDARLTELAAWAAEFVAQLPAGEEEQRVGADAGDSCTVTFYDAVGGVLLRIRADGKTRSPALTITDAQGVTAYYDGDCLAYLREFLEATPPLDFATLKPEVLLLPCGDGQTYWLYEPALLQDVLQTLQGLLDEPAEALDTEVIFYGGGGGAAQEAGLRLALADGDFLFADCYATAAGETRLRLRLQHGGDCRLDRWFALDAAGAALLSRYTQAAAEAGGDEAAILAALGLPGQATNPLAAFAALDESWTVEAVRPGPESRELQREALTQAEVAALAQLLKAEAPVSENQQIEYGAGDWALDLTAPDGTQYRLSCDSELTVDGQRVDLEKATLSALDALCEAVLAPVAAQVSCGAGEAELTDADAVAELWAWANETYYGTLSSFEPLTEQPSGAELVALSFYGRSGALIWRMAAFDGAPCLTHTIEGWLTFAYDAPAAAQALTAQCEAALGLD